MKTAFLLLFLTLLAGCSMPTTKVQTADERPSISVQGAPRGAILFVDGLAMGRADQYAGAPEILRLEPGIHEIRLVQNGAVIFAQRIFLDSAHKTISVR